MTIPTLNSCKVVAVDFDGTIFDRYTSFPFEHAPECVKWFRRWGYEIVIFSARASNVESIAWMKQWLTEHHIVFDDVTNVKPTKVTWIIDDRGIHFDNKNNNWLEITEAIKKETFPWKQ